MTLRCNICWRLIQEKAFITRCRHCFCETDGRTTFLQSRECPACHQPLSRKDVRLVVLEPPVESKEMMLCGYSPDDALQMFEASLQFWTRQLKVQASFEAHERKKVEEKARNVEQGLQEKIRELETQNKHLAAANRACEEAREAQLREYRELQERHHSAVRQKIRISDLYNQLKRKNDRLTMDAQAVQSSIGVPTLERASASPLPFFELPKSRTGGFPHSSTQLRLHPHIPGMASLLLPFVRFCFSPRF
eukprot:RCo019233